MTVTSAQVTTLLENVLFESSTLAAANATPWTAISNLNSSTSTVSGLAAYLSQQPEAGIAEQVVRYYMGALGRVPSAVEIAYYTKIAEAGLTAGEIAQGSSAVSGGTWAQIAAYFAASPEFQKDFGLGTTGVTSANEALVVTGFYNNILGRAPTSAEISYYENLLNTGTSAATLIQYFTESPEYQTKVDGQIAAALSSYGQSVVAGTSSSSSPIGTVTPVVTLTSDTLTTAVDTLNPTGNTIITGTSTTFTPGDSIVASGNGNSLNLSDAASAAGSGWNLTTVSGVTVSGVQSATVSSGVEGITVNTTAWAGLTSLTVDSVGAGSGTSITAASTTNVAASVSSAAAELVSILGGDAVTLTVSGATSNNAGASTTTNITIGSSTAAPAGAVSVTESVTVAAATEYSAAIAVTGGTTVSITENIAPASSVLDNSTVLGGTITVTGTTATTSVSVTQTAPVAASQTAVGITDGTVSITDANTAATTASAGTITSVSLTGVSGTNDAIEDNALTTLSVSSAIASSKVSINEEGFASAPTTLALTLSGTASGFIINDVSADYTTLNVTTAGKSTSTTYLNFEGDGGVNAVTAETVSGTATLNQTSTEFTSLKTITVTGGAGFNSSVSAISSTLTSVNASASTGNITLTIDDTKTAFTGGTGVDTITITNVATAAITAGSGTGNEIVWNGTAAPSANSVETLGTVTGFTKLGIGSLVQTAGFDLSKLTGFTAVDVQANTTGDTTTIANATAGTTALSIDGGVTGAVIYNTADTNGYNDTTAVTLGTSSTTTGFTVVGLTLSDSTNDGIAGLTFNTVSSSSAATTQTDQITTLTDGYVNSLTVTGTSGLTIVNMDDSAGTLAISATQATNVSGGTAPTFEITTLTDNALVSLTVSGSEAVTIGTLDITSGGSLTLTVSSSQAVDIGAVNDGSAAQLLVTSLSITDSSTATDAAVTFASFTDTALATLKLSGDVGLTYTSGINTSSSITVSAANDSGNLTIDTSLSTTANTITVGTGTDTVNLGTNGSTVTFGAHTAADTLALYTTATDSHGVNAASSSVSSILTSGMNVVTGLTSGDSLSLAHVGGYTQAGGLTAGATVAYETNLAGVNSEVTVARGTYSSGSFTYSATGNDTLLTYDTGDTAAGHDLIGVVLVGYHGITASTALSAGVLTL